MKNSFPLMLILIMMASVSCDTTKIYLVRHGEKLDNSRDTDLSETGKKRALALRERLSNEKIEMIFSTEYLRTKNTARPLADALSLDIKPYRTGPTFTDSIRHLKNKKILVVGHSNTLPEMIRELTGETIEIPEDAFNNLFTITFRKGKGELSRETYGN